MPQGQINEDIGVEGDELIGNEAENEEHPRGAANDQRNVTIPQGNGADWCNGECRWLNGECIAKGE